MGAGQCQSTALPPPLTLGDRHDMQRRLKVIFGAVLLCFAAFLFEDVQQFFRVDGCLDRGGRYDSETEACVGAKRAG